jgi:hypothetical protein
MKDASDIIRDWVYSVLNLTIQYGSAYVPVYSFVPKDAAFPYIVISEQMMTGEDGTKDKFITNHEVTIEIWSSFQGNDASYVPVNSISDSVLRILRQRTKETHGSGGNTITGFTGFNAFSITVNNMITDRFLMDTNIIIYKSINIKLILEET